ncbi:MAG: FAD-dependent oxidoreductase [Syntrophales bacterium]|nr:FAD-dependent oxidoreductase [Syntrophales bacterium]MDD5640346.1 FAD-dependent oxidoreductase [Syntrophales bacterium]
MMEERKFGVYLCKGCGIADAIDFESLTKVIKKEGKIQHIKEHDIMCSPEGRAMILEDLKPEGEGINCVVIAACSPRVKYEELDFPNCLVERCNIRELVAWTQEPKAEETQALAEDYLRMYCARVKKSDLPEPYETECDKTIMVIGGGAAGLSAALEAANDGYQVLLVEKEAELGGYGAKMYRQTPSSYPFTTLQEPTVFKKIKEVESHPNIRVMTSATIDKIEGQPGQLDAHISTNGSPEIIRVGSIVLAAGARPYDATKLSHLGYGASPDVITNLEMEALAKNGRIVRPSDGKEPQRVAFIQCAGSRDPDHLPYCSDFCCLTSLKQALYVRQQNPEALAYILYKDIRTPGQTELFYKEAQSDPGVMLTKAEVTGVTVAADGKLLVNAQESLLGNDVAFEADLVVLATGLVPATADAPVINLEYRQGPGLPETENYNGFADSNFICFPYETRRTAVYAAGGVRQSMTTPMAMEDGVGAACKAIQAVEHVAAGMAVHPRAWDETFPDPFMQRCTSCKRCTEECPFGAIEEDEKGTPFFKINRCRRCATCMGACPERIVSFKDYSVDIVGSMLKSLDIPELEDEDDPNAPFRIIGLVCENDAGPALDAVAQHRLRFDPRVRFIPLRCMGSFNMVWVSDALSRGVDGLLLMGCKYGDDYQCHFAKGSELCSYRLTKLSETLDKLGLEADRVQQIQVAISEFDKLPDIINDFVARVVEIGPNPFKEF